MGTGTGTGKRGRFLVAADLAVGRDRNFGDSLALSSLVSVPRIYHGDEDGDGEAKEVPGRSGLRCGPWQEPLECRAQPKHLLSSHYSEFLSCQYIRVCLSVC